MHRPNKTDRSVEQGDTHIGRSKGRRTNSGGDEQAFGAATNKLSQPSVRTVRVHHSKCVATAGEMEMDVDVDVDEVNLLFIVQLNYLPRAFQLR